jgi:hypothetical protein
MMLNLTQQQGLVRKYSIIVLWSMLCNCCLGNHNNSNKGK